MNKTIIEHTVVIIHINIIPIFLVKLFAYTAYTLG